MPILVYTGSNFRKDSKTRYFSYHSMTGYNLEEVQKAEDLPPHPKEVKEKIEEKLKKTSSANSLQLSKYVAQKLGMEESSARVITSEVLQVLERDTLVEHEKQAGNHPLKEKQWKWID